MSMDKVKESFQAMDADNSGFVEAKEFANLLKGAGFEKYEEYAKALVEHLDKDNDGKVSLEEIEAFMKDKC